MRLAAAEAEVAGLRALLAEVRERIDETRADRDQLRADRDGWRERAERLLIRPAVASLVASPCRLIQIKRPPGGGPEVNVQLLRDLVRPPEPVPQSSCGKRGS